MIAKTLLAALLCAAPCSVVPATAPVITYDEQRLKMDYPLVVKVSCAEGSGTAFRVGGKKLLSVAHVTSLHNCAIDGHPIRVIENDGILDFSVIEADLPGSNGFRIDCGGFRPSKWYWSAGYAYGLPYQTVVGIYSTAFTNVFGMQVFIGKHMVIPGMSGGPVLNAAGEVVGTVNAYHPLFGLSYSRALRDTSVCRA